MTQPIKLTIPTDVLDAVPALFGFWPTESLVALFLHVVDTPTGTGRILHMSARIDLPTDTAINTAADGPAGGPETSGCAAHLAELLTRYDMVMLIGYSADQDTARAVMQHLAAALPMHKIQGMLLATLPGWTVIDPEVPHVMQWTNPYPATTGPVAEMLAESGMRPTGTRADLEESVQAPDPYTRADYDLGRALDEAAENPTPYELEQMPSQITGWIRVYLQLPTTVIPEEAAWLAARLRHTAPRDALVMATDRDNAAALATLWQQIAAMTPDEDAVPVLAVLAFTAWLSGNGALSQIALQRAEKLPTGPGSSFAALIQALLDAAVPPAAWDEIRGELPDQ